MTTDDTTGRLGQSELDQSSLTQPSDQDENLSDLMQLQHLMQQLADHQRYNLMDLWQPVLEYAPGKFGPRKKHMQYYHAGLKYRFRLLLAPNQVAKSLSHGFEAAYHLTGLYPKWWTGRRFYTPVIGWVSSDTGMNVRDGPQRTLFGRGAPNNNNPDFGTGCIPRHHIISTNLAPGSARDLIDYALIQHHDKRGKPDGTSYLYFKFYSQGSKIFAQETIHFWWPDEDVPGDVYGEGIPRLTKHNGIFFNSYTPVHGITSIVREYLYPEEIKGEDTKTKADQRFVMLMGKNDMDYYTDKQINEMEASYLPHERRARIHGLPTVGSGLIFPFEFEDLQINPFPLPDHYLKGIGIDLAVSGTGHPRASVQCAYDPETDILYVIRVWKDNISSEPEHASATVSMGKTTWVFWPHDGMNKRDTGKGKTEEVYKIYENLGLRMWHESARYEDGENKGGPQAQEPIISTLYNRFMTQSIRFFRGTCEPIRDEMNLYHRDKNPPHKPVDTNDDALKALMYALMMLRHFDYGTPQNLSKTYPTALDNYDPLDNS